MAENQNGQWFDYLMSPDTPVAFAVESLINPDGDLYYGYVTNVKNKRFREIPNDFIFEMDVGQPNLKDGKWSYIFKRKQIKKSDIISASLDIDPLNQPDFGADYQMYKNPSSVQKEYRKAMGLDPDDKPSAGKLMGSKIFSNQKLFTGIVMGFLVLAIIVSFGTYLFVLLH